jgi:hypothetical protein
MPILEDIEFLERIKFFNGQRLLAGDLQSLESFDREMRWLHNLSLHQPGIGSGFAVSGKKGEAQLTATPGYALDAFGREIILTQSHVEQVPPVADNGSGKPALFDLLVAYPPDENLTASETRDGVCAIRGTVRVHEEPVFCWARLTDDGAAPVDPRLKQLVQQQLMIVLARVSVFNCQLKEDVLVAFRRNARPVKLPKVACGVTTVEGSDWKFETLKIQAPGAATATPVSVTNQSVKINTSSAGFSSTPSYFARLRSSDPALLSRAVFGAVINITRETPREFQFQLLRSFQFVPEIVPRALSRVREFAFDVVWMGVEV